MVLPDSRISLVEVSIAGFFILPDDGRATLHIAPKNDALDWDWGKQFIINGANGNVSGKTRSQKKLK